MKEYRVTYEVVIRYTKVLRFEEDHDVLEVADCELADKALIAEKLNADDFTCGPVGYERMDRSE